MVLSFKKLKKTSSFSHLNCIQNRRAQKAQIGLFSKEENAPFLPCSIAPG